MRITKKTILAMGLIASSLTLNSCDYNDNNEVLRRPTALVTVYPSAPDGFFMQLDDSTSLVPTNMKASPFGDKKVRALVNYTIEELSYGGNRQSVYVNWIDSIRTKQPVMTPRTTTCAGWQLWLPKYTASFAAAESSCTPRTTAIPPNPASFV